MDEQRDAPADEPDFGPGGYLPDRASRRARKIVLRAPMGIQWVIGSLVVGLVVVIAGWFALRDTTPAAPYVEIPAALTTGADPVVRWEDPRGSDVDALVVRSGARLRVFAWDAATTPVLCAATGQLEAPDGGVWRLTGRGLGGTPSLAQHPIIIDDGRSYADPTVTIDAPPPSSDAAETGCP